MSKVVDFRNSDNPRDVIHRAVQLLSQGEIVVLPTETYYLACAQATCGDAVRRLVRANSHGDDDSRTNGARPAEFLIGAPEQALDFLPEMPGVGRKLARRGWPGPLVLDFASPGETGIGAALPEAAQAVAAHRFRCPAHPVPQAVLRFLPAPLVAVGELERPSANVGGAFDSPLQKGSRTADEASARFADESALIVDDGPSRYGEPSTVVKVDGNQWRVERPGVLGESSLRRLAGSMFLFVCTGNTCRSPMAEALFRKLLSERLDCTEAELYDRGYVVASAGLSAASGSPASPEGIELVGRRGIDLNSHQSQPLTDELLDQADRIFAMTRGHLRMILDYRPDVARRAELLSRDGGDVPDPIGGSFSDYQACEREIDRHLRAILDELELEGIPSERP